MSVICGSPEAALGAVLQLSIKRQTASATEKLGSAIPSHRTGAWRSLAWNPPHVLFQVSCLRGATPSSFQLAASPGTQQKTQPPSASRQRPVLTKALWFSPISDSTGCPLLCLISRCPFKASHAHRWGLGGDWLVECDTQGWISPRWAGS